MYTSASSSWWMRSMTSPFGMLFSSNSRRSQMSAVFHFHVRGLRVDRRGKPLADERVQPADEHVIIRPQFFRGLEGAVAPVVGLFPEVALERQAEAAELAEHADPLRHGGEHSWSRVI